MNLTKTNWPLGWNPSADPVNGDPNGLLRMDNLQQDETGAITLVRGIQELSAFPDYAYDFYAKAFGPTESVYVGLNENGNSILRTKDGLFDDEVLIGSGNGIPCFGDALGKVFAIAGTLRVKDDTITTLPLGLKTPPTPVIGAISQPILGFFSEGAGSSFGQIQVYAGGTLSLVIGTLGSQGNLDSGLGVADDIESDATSCIVQTLYKLGGAVDTTQIPTFVADNPSNDLFSFFIAPNDPTQISSVTADVLLDFFGPEQGSNNYYSYTWSLANNNMVLVQGYQAQTYLSINRGGFQRTGLDTTLDWTKVKGIRLTVNCLSATEMNLGGAIFIGGAQGQLNGTYQYVIQGVNDNGTYVAMGPVSQPSNPTWIINGEMSIGMPNNDPQVTTYWIYRISATNTLNPLGGPFPSPAAQTFLNQYYRVGTATPGSIFADNTSDNEAIQIDLIANLYLLSMDQSDVNGLQDNITCIAGLFKARMLYMGGSSVWISDELNPDAIDTRFTLKAFGDPSEKNLWLKKVNNNVLILGTTKDLYEISGSFEQLPDGSFDATIIPIGEAYPPLCNQAAVVNGGVFYVAADGLRVSQGSTTTLLSPQLRLLFQGEARIGVPPVQIIGGNIIGYPITAGKTKIYFVTYHIDGTRRLVVYDVVNNTYTLRYTDPISVYATPTDRVLLGYGASGFAATQFGSCYLLDTGSGGVTDQNGNLQSGIPFTFQTVYDANQQPRNRKDTFTLKLICDTGGSTINVQIDKDNKGVWTQLGTINCSGLTTNYFPLPGVTLGFRYAIRLSDTNLVTSLRLYEYTIEYEPRPEQVDYLRILPTNQNSYARKRWTSFAYVIDTLGNNIQFQPYVDNTATGAIDTFSTATKLTHITFFDAETIGTDMGGIFSGGVFEFYGVNLEETVSEKLPTPTEYLVIPANNYGTPNRKRHTSYKFEIITRGQPVQLTPILDGVPFSSRVYNTSVKQTVEYFFDQSAGDVIGIDIAGILQSVAGPPLVPFEFYGVITPQKIEQLPDRLEYYRIPNTNYGVAAKKRIRTIPFVIDTYGYPVNFTPIVDGILQNSTSVTTSGKTTAFHFFNYDIFGIDYGGIVQSTNTPPQPFEFYELGQPENVEVLPVAKLFDQIGPLRFDKIGKIFTIRTKLISEGDTSIPVNIFGDTALLIPTVPPLWSGVLPVIGDVDQVWELNLPKSINTNVCRIVLGPTQYPFHRYDMQIRVSMSGMETDSKWIPAK